MCGIVGIVDLQSHVQVSDVAELSAQLKTRGPDAEGCYVYRNIGIGHRRLSIIDLDSGSQPMHDEKNEIAIVYNGEIYNFLDLKNQLSNEGYKFNTQSDTEVILAAYTVYGIEKTLQVLEGMYAFALVDKRIETLYLARDKYGEKPLYIHYDNKGIYFASEMKALVSRSNRIIDKTALNLFFGLTYIPAPYSIYKDIRKLEPATFLEIRFDGKIISKKYYEIKKKISENKDKITFNEAKIRLRELLYDSIDKRMISDVPIGSFLSGGIDSSIVSSIMNQLSKQKKVNTFSIGFNEKEYDESERAELMSRYLHSVHHKKSIDYNDVVNTIDEVILYFDEPFGDSSAIPSNEVAKLAQRDVKVVLTGDCADELFGGYEKYLVHYYVGKFKKLPAFIRNMVSRFVCTIPHTRLTNKYLRRIKKVVNNADLSDFDLHFEMMNLGVVNSERGGLFKEEYYADIRNILSERYHSYPGNEMGKGFYTDLVTVLEGDMLVKVDRMCMRNSLEARAPFLDSKLVEFAFSLPDDFKIKGTNKKYILKEAFRDILPRQTLRFKKKGFGVPVDYWLQNQLKPRMLKFLSEEFIEKQGIFNYNTVNNWYTEHLEGKENHKGKLWCYYVFQRWYTNQGYEKEDN